MWPISHSDSFLMGLETLGSCVPIETVCLGTAVVVARNKGRLAAIALGEGKLSVLNALLYRCEVSNKFILHFGYVWRRNSIALLMY